MNEFELHQLIASYGDFRSSVKISGGLEELSYLINLARIDQQNQPLRERLEKLLAKINRMQDAY